MRAATPEQIDAYTRQGWWGTETLIDLFLRQAERTPEAVALVDPPNRAEFTVGDPQRLTYAELRARVERLAAGLVRLGVGPDQVIMVQLPNIAELVICYLAAARIGAIISPVPVQYRTHELRQVLALAEPSAYLTARTFG
ncbi:MAG: AMP-binding protein, partial [Anaerolineae bacterium]|nr:AMP-binding protein [Anaerolineae bacterium]